MHFHDPDGSTAGLTGSAALVGEAGGREVPAVPALTILCHPDPRRVGERALLGSLLGGRGAQLARGRPEFFAPGETSGRALEDSYLSREPVLLEPLAPPSGSGSGGVPALRLRSGASRTPVVVDGQPLAGAVELAPEALDEGVVLELAQRLALLLHLHTEVSESDRRRFGLVGESTSIQRLREEIRRLGDLRTPVLIRGATGTGKELVARAIHEASPRAAGPFVGVNLGALPPSLAAAQLFGAARGAFTGAVREQTGFFRMAQGGTLFLDEIGEAPAEVQVMLLRALETGEVHPLGSRSPEPVDARVVAATDSDLEALSRTGAFREPLIHRLSGYVLWMPPLRRRRDDLGRLLVRFLAAELEEIGEPRRLSPAAPGEAPWLPASLVGRLSRHDWPGNVRQLRNVARQMVIASRGLPRLALGPGVERLLSGGAAPPPEPRAAPGGERPPARSRRPLDVDSRELAEALRANRWDLAATARQLGVSRPSLYNLIRANRRLRTAGELPAQEIRRAHQECGGDLEAMVDRLEVSAHALRRRVRELGLA